MCPPAIETDALRKTYGNTVALQSLDLSIEAGTIYGFLGPNGAGKTTTMRLLTGLSDPTSGTASLSGTPVDDRRSIADLVGYLPESPPLYGEFSGREQLEYVVGLRTLDADRTAERIEELLAQFDLIEDADRRISGYSTGMKQKVAYIQTILHDPPVLLLDEPTAGLDPRAARQLKESIAQLSETGTTVFLSTHILPVVEELADTIGVLYDGELVAEGSPDAVTERAEADGDATLEDAFLAVTSEPMANR